MLERWHAAACLRKYSEYYELMPTQKRIVSNWSLRFYVEWEANTFVEMASFDCVTRYAPLPLTANNNNNSQ